MSISPSFFPRCFASCLPLLAASAAFLGHAAPPPLEGLFPAGSVRGATNVVTVVGKQEVWPPKVWVSNPGVSFAAQTNKGMFLVSVQPDAVLGPCLVRLYNEEGASEPRIMVVDAQTGVTDAEPNNHFAKAQILRRIPVTIDGRLEKNGDVDSFSLPLKTGQWIELSVDSYTLMSKVDAALRLMTTNGVQLAWNHDFTTLDPRLVWRTDSNQIVVLQIFGFAYPPGSDIRLAGGETAIYRLHVNELDRAPEPCRATEKELSEWCTDCRSYEMPFSLQGRITRGDEERRFPFSMERGDIIEARIEASSLGSPLDACVRIEDAVGKELVRNDDDGGTRDPRLEWEVPSNGIFNVVVSSVTHRGGQDFCYRLSVQKMAPAFRVTSPSSSLILHTGATNELKLDVKRLYGHTNELIASVHGLPPCVTNLPGSLPTKDGTATIRLGAGDEACEFQGPMQVTVKDTVTGDERRVSFHLTSRGENSYARLLVESSEDFWLTVRRRTVDAKAKQEKP